MIDNLGSRLKDLRLKAGLTLRELARKAGVSPSFVSQIENGKSQPSVATLYTFAQLLDVSIDELFDQRSELARRAPAASSRSNGKRPNGKGPNGKRPNGNTNPSHAWHPSEYANRVSVVHPSHRSILTMADGVVWERLAATPEHSVNFMKITYAPGATSTGGGDLVSHDGYEYGYVLKGTLEIMVGSETFTLNEGESMGFDSRIPHRLRNVGKGAFEGIWFVHGREPRETESHPRMPRRAPRDGELAVRGRSRTR